MKFFLGFSLGTNSHYTRTWCNPRNSLEDNEDIYSFIQKSLLFFFSGKQRDFFTRTWGEDFTENQAIPPSPYVCQLSVNHCEKYLKKLRKYCPRHAHGGQHRGHVQSRS